eukprot:Hpha_TRINITY_DN18364_c0_g1::TRINITY_DN18364_c0_g1_i1::g.158124::m.158124
MEDSGDRRYAPITGAVRVNSAKLASTPRPSRPPAPSPQTAPAPPPASHPGSRGAPPPVGSGTNVGTPAPGREAGLVEWVLHPAFAHTTVNFVSYSAWTLSNKELFSSGDAPRLPLLSTGFQMVVVTIVCLLSVRVGWAPLETANPDLLRTKIIPLSVVRSSDLGFANAALTLMSVAAQQILKSTIPVWVCALTVLYLGRPVPGAAWAVVAVIVVGTAMATIGDPDMRAAPLGVGYMLLGCFCRAWKCVLNTRLLQGSALPGPKEETLSKMTVLRYEAPLSGLLILAAAAVFEGPVILRHGWSQSQINRLVCMNIVNGGMMFVNQYSYLGVVEHTSPVASQVLMNVKMIFLVFISFLIHPVVVGWVNLVGMILAAGGAVVYAWAASGRQPREPKNV